MTQLTAGCDVMWRVSCTHWHRLWQWQCHSDSTAWTAPDWDIQR